MPTATPEVVERSQPAPTPGASSLISLFLRRTPTPTPTAAPVTATTPAPTPAPNATPTPTPAPLAAVAPPTPEPPPGPNRAPGEIDPETSIVEEGTNILRAPVPLLWQGASFPLWLLLVLLLVALALFGATWRMLRRNRDY